MKTLLPLAACAVLLLSACGSGAGSGGPLTASECREMAEREIDLAMSAMPDADREGVREFMEKANAASAETCLAGDSWRREDYQCAKAATTPEAFGECMRVVVTRDE